MNNVCFSEHARNSSSVPIFYSSNYEDTLLMGCGLDSATVRRDAPSFFDMDSTSLPVLYSPSFSSNIEPSLDRGEQCSDTDHDCFFESGKNFENSVDSCFSLESSQPQGVYLSSHPPSVACCLVKHFSQIFQHGFNVYQPDACSEENSVAPVGVLDSSVRLPEQIVTNLLRAHHIRQVPADSHQNSVRSNSETNKSNQLSGGMRVPLSSTKPTHSFERTSQSTSSIKRPTVRELRNCSKPALTSKRYRLKKMRKLLKYDRCIRAQREQIALLKQQNGLREIKLMRMQHTLKCLKEFVCTNHLPASPTTNDLINALIGTSIFDELNESL
ncbi:unnamed protein product [Anisakis simplex]|uniref:BZIP domain-containing protein n=1 Tax=Anisakis simplex TaxID=6269 RepID=A0A0M3J898_ANISI|nr:unnamed protein product [Anisakis simplex]